MHMMALVVTAMLRATGPAEADLAFLESTDGFWQVWVMRSDGSGARQLTRSPQDKMRVSWYPDGRRLLVSGSDGRAYRVDLDKGIETPISTELRGFQDATLSPDGKHFAFSLSTSNSVDDHDIWMLDENGSRPQKLTSMPWLQHEPAWSPDGRYVYFLSGNGGQTHDIWRISLEGRHAEQLTANELYHFDVSISSKGDMVFSSNKSGNYDIWVRTADGKLLQLTDDAALDGHPTWSPDGTRLAFDSTAEGQFSLWHMNADGSGRARLTSGPAAARFPVWRSGGTQR